MVEAKIKLLSLMLMYSGALAVVQAFKLPETSSSPGIYLSINALAYTESDGTVVKRRLEATWHGRQVSEGDLILLELGGAERPDLEIQPALHPDGFYVSDVQVPYLDVEGLGNISSSCMFDYRVSWLDAEGVVLAESCLRMEPSWQYEHRDVLAKMKVGDLMLAGSHDAGAYRDYEGEGDDNWATSAVYAQEEDLLNQLLWGSRFLDIRVGNYPTLEDQFWLVHGIIKTHSLMEGISQVKEFLRLSRDVLVWEINGFEQPWTAADHETLKSLLVSEFGRWLVSPGELGWSTTLQDIWSREDLPSEEGRIIITYNNGYTDPQLFFREVLGGWGDVNEPEALYQYLNEAVGLATNNPAYQPWKPNCQMTPTAIDIIGGRWSGLREMADAVNRNVSGWWREEWTELGSTFSIHDFILSTDMVRESIRRSVRLAGNL